MRKAIQLSVVVPVYNSAEIFPDLCGKIIESISQTVDSFEIIAVVDGCRDDSAAVVEAIHDKDDRVKLVELSRNFGQQAAISAGLFYSSGDMVVVMDDDFEDPPEIIPQMIAKAKQGFDVVYGIRRGRKKSWIERVVFHVFYRILRALTALKMPSDAGDFALMKRPVVDVLNSLPESNLYLRGLRSWAGFQQVGIPYDRGRRASGDSGYGFFAYLNLAVEAIFSFSHIPLRIVSFLGLVISGLSLLAGGITIAGKLTGLIRDVPGWASLVVILFFLSGVQLVALGTIGEYVGRIYSETKRRPKFVAKKMLGLGEASDGER